MFQKLLLKAIGAKPKQLFNKLGNLIADVKYENNQVIVIVKSVARKLEKGEIVKVETNSTNYPELDQLTKNKNLVSSNIDPINENLVLIYNVDEINNKRLKKASKFVSYGGEIDNTNIKQQRDSLETQKKEWNYRISEFTRCINEAKQELAKLDIQEAQLNESEKEYNSVKTEIDQDDL